jgi:uncharacterized protein (TIGR02246 family)
MRRTRVSTAENKKLVDEIYQAIAQGDRSKFVAHLAEDAVLTVTGENSWSGVHRGKESIVRFFRVVAELAPGVRKTIPFRILADEDSVVVEARGDMTTKAGVPYRNHYCLLFRLKDGMIVEMKEYLDSAYCERVLGVYPGERARA